jgi:hypothetical protein
MHRRTQAYVRFSVTQRTITCFVSPGSFHLPFWLPVTPLVLDLVVAPWLGLILYMCGSSPTPSLARPHAAQRTSVKSPHVLGPTGSSSSEKQKSGVRVASLDALAFYIFVGHIPPFCVVKRALSAHSNGIFFMHRTSYCRVYELPSPSQSRCSTTCARADGKVTTVYRRRRPAWSRSRAARYCKARRQRGPRTGLVGVAALHRRFRKKRMISCACRICHHTATVAAMLHTTQ